MLGAIYNTDILTLSASLRNETLDDPAGTSRKVSKLCGSSVEVDVVLSDGQVSDVGLRVEACALGQASAAILQERVIGATLPELKAARSALWLMLKEKEKFPNGRFERLSLLENVSEYPARHQSVMLAWDAVIDAFETAQS